MFSRINCLVVRLTKMTYSTNPHSPWRMKRQKNYLGKYMTDTLIKMIKKDFQRNL